MNKKINKILFPVLMWLIPLTAAVYGYAYSVHSLSDYIFSQTAKPFLAQITVPVHSTKIATTIQTSLIEFKVLKLPTTPIKTPAKK